MERGGGPYRMDIGDSPDLGGGGDFGALGFIDPYKNFWSLAQMAETGQPKK